MGGIGLIRLLEKVVLIFYALICQQKIFFMQKFNFSDISLKDLKSIVELRQKGIADYRWTAEENIAVTEDEKFQLRYITAHTKRYPAHVMNEATLWARAIYPLLQLAERGEILATSEVTLAAQYSTFEVHGIIDGILMGQTFKVLETLKVYTDIDLKNYSCCRSKAWVRR